MKRMTRRTVVAGLFITTLSSSWWALAGDDRGKQIAVEARRRHEGFKDSSVKMTMTLRDKKRRESVRRLTVHTLEVSGDGDKSLIFFVDPRDVKGTALLTWSHRSAEDEQWLYMPALRRVKRISSSNRSGPFMGSEFAYEDLVSEEVERYTYHFLGEEKLDGRACFVLKRIPVNDRSGYQKQKVWYDKQDFKIWKIEYWDRHSQFLKTLTLSHYELYEGKHWRALRMNMQNHVSGKSTEIRWSTYAFGVGLGRASFTKGALESGSVGVLAR